MTLFYRCHQCGRDHLVGETPHATEAYVRPSNHRYVLTVDFGTIEPLDIDELLTVQTALGDFVEELIGKYDPILHKAELRKKDNGG